MKKSLLIILICTRVFVFAQSGITWTMGMNISANTFSNMHPRITLDGTGNPMVIWGRMSDESVLFSRWNGTMFTTPVKLNPMWLTVASAGWMGPDIASHGDTVYVVAKQTPEADTSSHIYIMTSFNAGVSFSPPVRVDFIADSISRFPTLAVDATGNPLVAFMKFDGNFGDARWVVTKSADYGNTFTPDTKASGQSGGVVCDCCPGSIINNGNNVAMLYRSNMSNIRDTWAGMSANDGNTFPVGFNVDQNSWNLFNCPSSGPDGEILGDTLYTVFMNGASGISRTYMSKSSISGSSVNSVNPLTGTIPSLGQQNYPRIAASGNAVAITWKQSVNSADQLALLFTNNIASGFPASYDTVDLNSITNADVALSNGNIFVVWQDDGSGTVKYRSGTYPQASTGISESISTDLSFYPNPVTTALIIKSENNLLSEILVTDVFGRRIYSENSKMQEKTINVSGFQKGIYFIHVKTTNSFYFKKFIKI